MPEISIIIPVYNAEKYLNKCLRSVISQTFADFELILVNDGSKDSSLSICQRYAEKDKRIRIIDKENEGTVKTRARGLREAKGNYITFVDADDWISRNALEHLFRSVKETGADICVGKIIQVVSSVGLIKREYSPNFYYYFAHSDLFAGKDVDFIRESFLYAGCFPGSLCTKLFKRSLFENSYDYIGDIKFLGDDQYWNMGLFRNADKVSLINEHIYYYRGLFGNTSKYMPYFFHDVICGWENKIKAAADFCDNPEKAYGCIAQAQIDLLEACVVNLFSSDMNEDEIKAKIKEFVSNDKVQDMAKLQIDGFAVDFTNALRNMDAELIFEQAKATANNRGIKAKLLRLLKI